FFVARRAVKLMDKRKRSQVLGVANKVASPRHRRMIAAELERLKIPYWAEIPADPDLAEAERHGHSAAEVSRNSPALKAIEKIARRLKMMEKQEEADRARKAQERRAKAAVTAGG
ncbi:MAG: hypothetical protein ACRDIU_01675, partial [Actinomycetota bacterium]